MNNTPVKITSIIESTDPTAELGLEIWIDQQLVLDQTHVSDLFQFTHWIDDSESDVDHTIRFVLKNKQHQHTQIDAAGNILSDARIKIKNLCFDEIDLGHLFYANSKYSHDGNGSQPLADDDFFGEMGCNGEVRMSFTTPIYLWLLEQM